MSTVALVSCLPCSSALSSRPVADQSLAAFSTTRRARRAITCASISSVSGAQLFRNASWATVTKVRSAPASVDRSRRSMNGCSTPATLGGNSSSAARLFVGLPCWFW